MIILTAMHYQVDLLNGQLTKLNICGEPADTATATYQYVSSLNKSYYKPGTRSGSVSDPTGALSCDIDGYFDTFLYYMMKQ